LGLAKLIGHVAKRSLVLLGKHHPAAATAAVITVTAVAGRVHVVQGIQWSYSEAPTGGRLTVVLGATTVIDLDITSAGPGGFGVLIPAGTNTTLVVTLASGAGTCVGKLNMQYTTESSLSK
jgi:hypothetical protein